MKIEVISTGTELLKGVIANTDLAIIGRQLAAAGRVVAGARTVGDSRADLIAALHAAAQTADVVLISGGLGPTRDDLSREVAAEFFDRKLVRRPELADGLRRGFRRFHPTGAVPRDLFRQADVPEGAEVLPNTEGTAPGLYFSAPYGGRTRHLFLLPGPPNELEPMFAAEVMPRLAALDDGGGRFTRGFLVVGAAELLVQQRAEALCAGRALELAYCAGAEGTRLFVSGGSRPAVEEAAGQLHDAFGAAALPVGVFSVAGELVGRLAARGWRLALAESCTGGLTAGAVTAVPGASAVFQGGVVAYDNAVKQRVLGVPENVLAGCGAVSSECAAAMAEGAARLLGTELAGSVTGIAGPGGGTAEKPVGLVWFGVCCRGRVTTAEFRFRGNRETVRARAAARLLLLLREALTAAEA